MPCASYIILLILSGMLLMRIDMVVAEDECNTNSDCESKSTIGNVCCVENDYRHDRKCMSDSCSGQYCSTDGDCGGRGECCKLNKCVSYGCTECHNNFNCANSEYCCKQKQAVDINVCRRSCVGEPCFSKSDCGSPTEKCDSNKTCSEVTSTGGVAGYVLGITFVSLIFGFCCIGISVYRRCARHQTRRRPPQEPQRVVRQLVQSTTAIIAVKETHIHATMQLPPSDINRGLDPLPPARQMSPSPQPLHFPSS